MDELEKNNGCFLTFRAMTSEPHIFENFINIFLPIVTTKFPTHIYSVEKDDSPDRHLHLFFLHNEKDTQKLKQKLYPKAVRDFFKSLDGNQTKFPQCFLVGRRESDPEDVKFGFTMTLEDKMKALAYCCKDICRRQVCNNISQEVMTQSCKFYYATEKSKPPTEKGWTIINGRNFHVKLEQFARENSMSVHDYELIPKMTHQHHSFQMSAREQKKDYSELKFAHKKYNVINPEIEFIMGFDDIQPSEDHDLGVTVNHLKEELSKAKQEIESYKKQVEFFMKANASLNKELNELKESSYNNL